jgi:hypothetical protein
MYSAPNQLTSWRDWTRPSQLLDATAMQATCVRRECPKWHIPSSNNKSILQNLATELLVEIFQHLGWEDVFVMRRVSLSITTTIYIFVRLTYASWRYYRPASYFMTYRSPGRYGSACFTAYPTKCGSLPSSNAQSARIQLRSSNMSLCAASPQRYDGQMVPNRVYAFFRCWTGIPRWTQISRCTIKSWFWMGGGGS